MRRIVPLLPLLLAATAAFAAGCGDDSAADTSSTSSSGGGEGGSGPGPTTGSTGTGEGGATTASTTTGSTSSTTTSTSTGSAMCGDDTVDPGEECDDGNTEDGDGCSSECVVEVVPGCGNGVIEADLDEECDDGNDEAFDGCEADCTVSPEEIVCENLAALPGGGCEVDPGNGAKLLVGDVLLPYTALRGGQVAIDEDGIITCVGCDCAAIEPGATVVTCPEGVISPGLINPHEHITFAQNNPATDTGERYEHRHDWRRGNNGHTEIPAQGGGGPDVVRWGELRFLLSGATSLVGSGAASGFLRNLDRDQKEGLNLPSVHFETFPLNDSNGMTANSGCGTYDIDTQESIALDLAYLPHISEGINQAARNEFTCVEGSPGEDLLENQSAFIHAIGLLPSDYAEMATEGTSLIWSPRSNVVLYGDTAMVTVAARAGVNIAIGTDWIVSGSMNMFRELACAASLSDDYYDGFFTRRDLWRMVTVNAARSLGLETVLGRLAVGAVGDVAIFDGSSEPLHGAVVDGEIDGVHLVLRGGGALYGDTSVLDDLPDAPAGCEPLDQCLSTKSVCVQSELGQSYAAFRAAAGNLYGPFYCGNAPGEPSCHPTRPVAVNGSTTYSGNPNANDDDGDGIDNAEDNCPTVFNPIRPVDNGAQGDEDNDGVGDACDPCPLEADVTDCVGIDPRDEDDDGIANVSDNCPFDKNVTQVDSDGDGKGDLCDACPDAPNPGFAPCAVTIYDVKTGAAQGPVFLSDVLVTACANGNGFFVQHKEGDAAFDGPENSGLYVYDPGVVCGSDVTAGDRIDISGETSVFFSQIQLGFANYQILSSGEAAPAPVVLTAAIASGTTPDEWEGVFARVENVSVTNTAPAPGPGDNAPTGEFEVAGALRVDNFVFTAMPLPGQGTSFSSITGVLVFKNGNQKLEPRGAGDLVQ